MDREIINWGKTPQSVSQGPENEEQSNASQKAKLRSNENTSLTSRNGTSSWPSSHRQKLSVCFLEWSELKWSEVNSLSRVRLFVTPWTVAYRAPPSMGSSRQEYWRSLPCPLPGDLPGPGNQPCVSYIFCIGRRILHHQRHLGSEVKWSEFAQSYPTLCDPMGCSLPGSSVHGIFQTIVLEWIAISFSRGSSQPRVRTWVSRIVGRCFTVWATWDFLLRIPFP